MARRARRSGVSFIENDRDRSLTFFKRRAGLYKAAVDLSTLTGARLAIVLESESGKFSSFGAPATDPIVDAFLSGEDPMVYAYASEKQRATIVELQNEGLRLEKDLVLEDQRRKEFIGMVKELQESSRVAKFVYDKVEDLDVDELHEMYRELSHVHQETQLLLRTTHQGGPQEVSGLRDPSLLNPTSRHSLPLQMPLSRVLPWTPIQPHIQLLPMLAHTTPTWSQSSIVYPMMLQQEQLPPRSVASSMAPLQEQKRLALIQAIPNNYSIWGMGINSNNSNLLFRSPIISSPSSQPPSLPIPKLYESFHHASPPQQLSSHISIGGQLPFKAQNYDHAVLYPSFASPDSTSAPTPIDKPYYTSLGGLNTDLGKTEEIGGQTDVSLNLFGFSSGPLQGDGWIDEMISETSSVGGNTGASARNNLLGA